MFDQVNLIRYILVFFFGFLSLMPMSANAQTTRDQLYDSAFHAYYQDHPQQAINTLQQMLKKYPKDVEGWSLLGMAYTEMEKYTEALQAYDQALVVQPDYHEKGWFYFRRARVLKFLGKKKLAIDNYHKAFEKGGRADNLYYAADLWRKLGNLPQAIADLDRAIKKSPAGESYWDRRAWYKSLQGDYQGALADYKALYKLNPANPMGRDGIRDMEDKLKEKPVKPLTRKDYAGLIRFFIKEGAFPATVTWSDTTNLQQLYNQLMLESKSDHPLVVQKRNDLLRIQAREAKANPVLSPLEQAKKVFNDSKRKALGMFTKLYEASGKKDAEALFWMAKSHRELFEYKLALRRIKELEKLSPAYAKKGELHFLRGEIEEALKQPQAALQSYSKAIALSPQTEEYYWYRGTLYYYQDKPKKALADYEHLIKLNPKNHLGYLGRANIKFNRKDYESALADYKISLQYDEFKTFYIYKQIAWCKRRLKKLNKKSQKD